jgi:AcrR family transcriptional regulator
MSVAPAALPARRPRGRPRANEFEKPLKDLLIAAAGEVVSKHGTTDSSARRVAERVGVQPASINYNFGSWNGLIAHAGHRTYIDYSTMIWKRVKKAPLTPEDRLKGFLNGQHSWAKERPGWAAFFNFPLSAKTASDIMFDRFGHDIRYHFELNYARLYRLAKDVHNGSVTEDNGWAEKAQREAIMADSAFLAEAIVLGWTSLGMTVWGARDQIEILGGVEARRFNDYAHELAFEAMIQRLRSLPRI